MCPDSAYDICCHLNCIQLIRSPCQSAESEKRDARGAHVYQLLLDRPWILDLFCDVRMAVFLYLHAEALVFLCSCTLVFLYFCSNLSN